QGEYDTFLEFVSKNNNIGYEKFDKFTTTSLNLFAMRESCDFEELEQTLHRIIAALPAIKRIFACPIMRLTDSDEILPVESVKVINNRSIVHASVHSELWREKTKEGVKPKKLLTIKYEDNYAIYENIGFAKAINIISAIVSQNIRILQDILFANKNLKFNLLERENHLSYFLALGKLHIGYVRDYDKYRISAKRCMDKLLFIDRAIGTRLNNPVYKQCKRYADRFSLKKTMVFRMHKDYNKVYTLLKWFADEKIEDITLLNQNEMVKGKGYDVYCRLLSVFAAGHFNFEFDNAAVLDFMGLDTVCTFKDWELEIKSVCEEKFCGIDFTFKKDKTYKIFMVTSLLAEDCSTELLKEKHSADSFVFADSEKGDIVLSVYDIESFRRIQQLLLRGMICSDEKLNVCPFCGSEMSVLENDAYECEICRTQIVNDVCPETQQPYFYTTVKNLILSQKEYIPLNKREEILYKRQREAQMYFRNITELGENGEIICPRCHKIHM
ncbi:MAG: hypothetical protein J6D52_07850, partial [Clostridia bacterium]|nr:hypothetical protein [Clostridia bacterium]